MSLVGRNDIFNDIFNLSLGTNHRLDARANVSSTKAGILVEVELPGYSKSDIAVDAKNGVLIVTATRAESKRDYHQKEFGSTTIKRSWTLPRTIDLDRVDAAYDAGILSVELPYRVEASENQRKIEVR